MGYDISIDVAGRIVIPKMVRERLNLVGGTVLRLELEEDRLTLSLPKSPVGSLDYEDGALIIAGELIGDPPTLEQIRRERIHHVLGL